MHSVVEKQGIIHDLDFETIFELSHKIRFVGVCNMQGQLLDAQYRKGITPLLNDSALQFSVMRTAIRSATRTGDEGMMGKPVYSLTRYENVIRATIPFDGDLLFLVSFDKDADVISLIESIIQILQEKTA